MQNAEIDPVTKLIPPEALYKTDSKKYSLPAILEILVKLTWAFAMKTAVKLWRIEWKVQIT